jgi:hypothetical protein
MEANLEQRSWGAVDQQPWPDSEVAASGPLDYKATVRGFHDAYLSLTGNRFRVEVGNTTTFVPERRTIVIGEQGLRELGVNDPFELHFIILGQLWNLREFRGDTAGYLKLVESCNQDPQGQMIFELYRVVMDIYANRGAANRAAVLSEASGEFAPLIKELYLTKLYPEHDLTELPLAGQFLLYMLLSDAGIAKAYTVSEPIKAIFDTKLQCLGQEFTIPEFVREYLHPVLGADRANGWQGTIGQRKTVVDRYLLPIFKSLLRPNEKLDLPIMSGYSLQSEGLQDGKPGDKEGGSGDIELYSTPDIGDLSGMLECIQQDQLEMSQSAKERANSDLARQARGIAKAAKLKDPGDFVERLQRLNPTINYLVDVLQRIKLPAPVQIKESTRCSTRGDLSIPEVIRKFGKVMRDPESADVYLQRVTRKKIQQEPVNLRLFICPDLSGSMSSCIEGLRDNVVALSAAVASLCAMNRSRGTGVVSELAVYGYDGQLHKILDPVPDASLKEVASAYQYLNARGGTCEYLALERVWEMMAEIAGQGTARKYNRSTVNISLTITDGDTTDSGRTEAARAKLLSGGVEAFGVFLKSSGSYGKTFKDIWSDRGYELDSVSELPRIVGQIVQRVSQANLGQLKR